MSSSKNYVKVTAETELPSGRKGTDSVYFFFTRETAAATATAMADLETLTTTRSVTSRLSVFEHDPAFSGVPCAGGCFACDPGHDERREAVEEETE